MQGNSARSRRIMASRGGCWQMPGGTWPQRRRLSRPGTCRVPTSWRMTRCARARQASWKRRGSGATSRGGHIAVQDAVLAQFGSSIRALRSFSRLRRARNSFEYPSTETPGPSEDDVKDAIRVAREVNDAAGKILESGILSPW